MEKRGGTTAVLDRRAGDRRGKREREPRTYEQGNTGTRPVDTEDTNGARDSKRHEYVYISANDKQTNRIGDRLQPIRPANRCRCLIVYARKRYNGGAAGSTRVFLEATRASRKPAEKRAMANAQRRSVQFRSDSTSSSLMREPLLTASPSLL